MGKYVLKHVPWATFTNAPVSLLITVLGKLQRQRVPLREPADGAASVDPEPLQRTRTTAPSPQSDTGPYNNLSHYANSAVGKNTRSDDHFFDEDDGGSQNQIRIIIDGGDVNPCSL